LLTDLDGKDAEYWNQLFKMSDGTTFIYSLDKTKKLLEELLVGISINDEEAIQKMVASIYPQTL